MEIRSLNNICLNELFEAFEQAFADYDVQLNLSLIHISPTTAAGISRCATVM